MGKVDPFHGGILVERGGLAALVRANSGAVTDIAAMPNRAVLIRLLLNQTTRAEQAGQGRRALTLFRRMTALAPDYEQVWWETARLQLVDRDIISARASLGAILEINRDPELRRRVNELLHSVDRN